MNVVQSFLADQALEAMSNKANVSKQDIIDAIDAGAVNVVKRFEEFVQLGAEALIAAYLKKEVSPEWAIAIERDILKTKA